MSTLLMQRYLKDDVLSDLKKKMVFIAGPRQVGKTTFAKNLSKKNLVYLNWDDLDQREDILKKNWPVSSQIVIFDEIHKDARWRGLVKGYYDTLKESYSFIITGSARLDYYRKGGDSLFGRYRSYRLHPFSLSELGSTQGNLEALIKFGGFPEPILEQNERTWRRWQKERLERVIYDDLRDLEKVREVTLIQRLAEMLPARVGAPLSVKNISQDLGVDHKTADRWIDILENLYYAYRISPFGSSKIRAVKKEQKLYLWDSSSVEEEGYRFENLVANHLLKYCHFLEDTQGHKMELRFLRDTDKREIDFVVLKDSNPVFAVECKSGEKNLSKHISYFSERTHIPYFYQIHRGKVHKKVSDKIEIIPFFDFCKREKIP